MLRRARVEYPGSSLIYCTMNLQILYADDAMLVLDKPAGILAVPGRGADKQDCVAVRAQAAYPDALIVHRLDMATSGLLLMARGKEAQRLLSELFAHRAIQKFYTAVVAGHVECQYGEINLPLLTDWPNRPRQKVDYRQGKPSLTQYRVLSYDREKDTTRIELIPQTGRSHQLRVHMQALGHAILGDALYAPSNIAGQTARLCLHATAMCFNHPWQQKMVRFSSEVPF